MTKRDTQTLVKKILDEKKISKYRLAKMMKVKWNTVRLWQRGVFQANDIHYEKLTEIKNGQS